MIHKKLSMYGRKEVNTKIWKKIFILVTGLTIAHLGVTFFIQADLGTDPFNVLVQGVFRRVPWPDLFQWTHGRTHMLISVLIIGILIWADRSYVKVGTVICMALGGPIIDMFTAMLGGVINNSLAMPLRVGILIGGCMILAFGMTIVIKSEAGTGPNDLVAIVISDKSGKAFGIVRILTDVCFVAVGFLLGGTFGIGTVICAFVVGPVAQFFMPYSERICHRVIGE